MNLAGMENLKTNLWSGIDDSDIIFAEDVIVDNRSSRDDHFARSWINNCYSCMTINLNDALWNSISLQEGDEIGIQNQNYSALSLLMNLNLNHYNLFH